MTGLVSFALGLCAKRALDGATWAKQVLHEPQAPVDLGEPGLAIYVGRGSNAVIGRDLLNATGEATLLLQMFIPPSMTAAGFTFDSDSSQTFIFACLWRQIVTALLTDVGPWASLYREFAFSYKTIESGRGLFEGEKGERLAVCEVRLAVETLSDPPIGSAPCGAWANLLAAMTADGGELASLAGLMASMIQGSTTALPSWQVAMSQLGATADEINAIGLGPGFQTSDLSTGFDNFGPPLETIAVSATPAPGP